MNHAPAIDRQLAKTIAQAWIESPTSFLVEARTAAADFMQLSNQVLNVQQADASVTIPAKPPNLDDGSLNPGFDQVVPLNFCGFCRASCS